MKNKMISLVFQLLYGYMSFLISVNYHSDEPLKYIFGLFIGIGLISICENVIFYISFSLVGNIWGGKGIGDPNQKSAAHWIFRVVFITALYLINKLGWLNSIIDYLAGIAANKHTEFWNNVSKNMIDSIMQSLNHKQS